MAELRASGTARTVTLTIASKNWSAAAASLVVAAFVLRDGGESAAAAFAPMAIARITTQAHATAARRAKATGGNGVRHGDLRLEASTAIDAGGPPSRQYSASPMSRKRFSSDIATIEARPPPV